MQGHLGTLLFLGECALRVLEVCDVDRNAEDRPPRQARLVERNLGDLKQSVAPPAIVERHLGKQHVAPGFDHLAIVRPNPLLLLA